MTARGSSTLTSDISMDELKKVLIDEFAFLPNWKDLLDPFYDYDFCHIDDSKSIFYRGERQYYRPIGWKRFALKVEGQYENDDWFGKYNDSWIVAYHGTEEINCLPITEDGFKISSGTYGSGVYVSPLVDFAAAYARPVTLSNGLKVAVIVQSRIKPGSFSEHHIIEDTCPKNLCNPPCAEQFPYFKGSALEYVVSDPTNVRPYGICVKVLTQSEAESFKIDADSISNRHSTPKELEVKPIYCQIL